jgi:pyruvoyl-dependent arginine decarboxylase (PvlArgDC)
MNPAHLEGNMDFSVESGSRKSGGGSRPSSGGQCSGWLMTAVAPWGDTTEDAFDQCLVELGLGDSRLIRMEGAMLPMGFSPTQPEDLAMGSLVECHVAQAYADDGATASAGVAWAECVTPEGDECAIVATLSTNQPYEETELMLKRELKQKMSSRDLEVVRHEMAVDEVTAAKDHHGCAVAALIIPNSLNMQSGDVGRVRGGYTRSADAGFSSGARTAPRAQSRRNRDDVSFDL